MNTKAKKCIQIFSLIDENTLKWLRHYAKWLLVEYPQDDSSVWWFSGKRRVGFGSFAENHPQTMKNIRLGFVLQISDANRANRQTYILVL